jgi:hypothetical protein
MPKNYNELMEEAGRLIAEGEQLHREAFQHLDDPEILAAVDRYIVNADLWAMAMDEKWLED